MKISVKPSQHEYLIPVFSLLLLAGLISCSRDNAPYVAKVDSKKIYYEEYNKSFFLEPVYRRGETYLQARKKQLNLFVEEKLLAYGGEGIDADTSAFYQSRLAWYRKKALADAYLDTRVLDKIVITSPELRKGFEKRRKRVHLRHIFFRDSLKAALALKKLREKKTSFRLLAEKQFGNPQLRKSAGDLGICRYGELDEQLEEAAFSLKAGELYPGVVRSEFGYHIIQAEEIYIDMLPTRENFAIYKKEVEGIIKTREMRKRRRKVIKELTNENPVNIRLPSFELLADFSRSAIARDIPENQAPIIPNVFGEEIRLIGKSLKDRENDILVTFGKQKWTIKDFLKELKSMPPAERPRIDDEKHLFHAVKYMVLDELMAAEASLEGLDKRGITKRKIEAFRDKLSAGIYKDYLISSVTVNDGEVDSFFISNYGKLPAKRQKNIYNYMRSKLLSDRRSKILKSALDSLKSEHPVAIVDSLLLKDIPAPDKKIDFTPTPVIRKRLY